MTARRERAQARRLVVGCTWDGVPVPAAARTTVDVGWQERPDSTSSLHLLVRVDAPFHGDPPPAAPAGPTPGLWLHEVVELFVAGPGGPDDAEAPVEYLEVELGPHGHHLALRLRGVRRVVESGMPLDYRVEHLPAPGGGVDRWRGEARLPAPWLPPRPWRLNAYAIHGTGPGRRHLAMKPVLGPAPDFHRPERFVAWESLRTP